MICPYCHEWLRDDSLRCKHCQGDLLLYKYLRERVREHGVGAPSPTTPELAGPPLLAASAVAAPRSGASLLAICVLILILAYWLVGLVLRADGLPLRAISLIIPLPLGVLYVLRSHASHGRIALASAIVPTLAMIGGRLTAVAWNGEALLGRDHTWDYLLGYWISMALAFTTGAYLGRLAREPRFSLGATGHLEFRELVGHAKQVGPLLGPVASGIAAAIAGLGEYISK